MRLWQPEQGSFATLPDGLKKGLWQLAHIYMSEGCQNNPLRRNIFPRWPFHTLGCPTAIRRVDA